MTLRFVSVVLFGMTILALTVLLNEALTIPIRIASVLLIAGQWALIYKSVWVMQLIRRVNLIKNIGALLMMFLIAPSGKELGLLNSMVNLLFSGTVLWLFTANFNSRRWAKQVFVGIQLLIAVAFIYQQSLAWSLFSMACVLVSLIGLYISQEKTDQRIAPSHLASHLPPKFLMMTLSGIGLASILFFVMPALKPFWKLPEQKQNATGLSDSMTPGDIASLASSKRLAFRVQIESDSQTLSTQIMQHENRYWRVLTLENFDGKTWTQAPIRKWSRQRNPQLERNQMSEMSQTAPIAKFSVIAEASQQPWLIAFGTSISGNGNIITTSDSRLLHRDNIVKRAKYDFNAHAMNNSVPLNSFDQQLNLRLPNSGLDQTRRLAEKLWQQASAKLPLSTQRATLVKSYNQLVLAYFREQEFRYTLQPKLLSGDHIDDFLFNTQEGFCAHFASAHATLLRLVGIPARVVTGYHGGEFNAVGNYYNIDDSTAHAWVEFSADDKSWIREDPTAMASPARLQFGLEQALEQSASAQNDPANFVRETPWLNQLRQQLQSLDYYWTVWVLDYDKTKRENKFRTLITNKSFWLFSGIAAILLLLGLLAYWAVQRKTARSKSPERLLIQTLYKHLHRINKRSHETEIDWSKSVKQHEETLKRNFPDQSRNISSILENVNRLIYNKNVFANSKNIKNDIANLS